MWDEWSNDPGPSRKIASGSFDGLLDAEREAMARDGRGLGKIALIKALREASGLGLKEAKDVVEDYLARRTGADESAGRPPGWLDGLIDAERARAVAEGRPVDTIMLIKAVREASGLGLKGSKDVVDEYFRRRGGRESRGSATSWLVVMTLVLGLAAFLAYYFAG